MLTYNIFVVKITDDIIDNHKFRKYISNGEKCSFFKSHGGLVEPGTWKLSSLSSLRGTSTDLSCSVSSSSLRMWRSPLQDCLLSSTICRVSWLPWCFWQAPLDTGIVLLLLIFTTNVSQVNSAEAGSLRILLVSVLLWWSSCFSRQWYWIFGIFLGTFDFSPSNVFCVLLFWFASSFCNVDKSKKLKKYFFMNSIATVWHVKKIINNKRDDCKPRQVSTLRSQAILANVELRQLTTRRKGHFKIFLQSSCNNSKQSTAISSIACIVLSYHNQQSHVRVGVLVHLPRHLPVHLRHVKLPLRRQQLLHRDLLLGLAEVHQEIWSANWIISLTLIISSHLICTSVLCEQKAACSAQIDFQT